MFFCCDKQPDKEIIYCGLCQEQVKMIQDSFCGREQEFNQWLYLYAMRNEINKEQWICIIKN